MLTEEKIFSELGKWIYKHATWSISVHDGEDSYFANIIETEEDLAFFIDYLYGNIAIHSNYSNKTYLPGWIESGAKSFTFRYIKDHGVKFDTFLKYLKFEPTKVDVKEISTKITDITDDLYLEHYEEIKKYASEIRYKNKNLQKSDAIRLQNALTTENGSKSTAPLNERLLNNSGFGKKTFNATSDKFIIDNGLIGRGTFRRDILLRDTTTFERYTNLVKEVVSKTGYSAKYYDLETLQYGNPSFDLFDYLVDRNYFIKPLDKKICLSGSEAVGNILLMLSKHTEKYKSYKIKITGWCLSKFGDIIEDKDFIQKIAGKIDEKILEIDKERYSFNRDEKFVKYFNDILKEEN